MIDLTRFLNQLLLLLDSGMVLEEAFYRIGEGYEAMPVTQRSKFSEEFCHICQMSQSTGENVVWLFYQFSRKSGVKEMIRVANMMTDSMDRGTDLWEQLYGTCRQLWTERKRLAMEQIRIGESKMSFPLGLLLMALIIVTSAPALMTI